MGFLLGPVPHPLRFVKYAIGHVASEPVEGVSRERPPRFLYEGFPGESWDMGLGELAGARLCCGQHSAAHRAQLRNGGALKT